MKARLPKNYNRGTAPSNVQQIIKQANQIHEKMDVIENELKDKDFFGESSNGAIKVTVRDHKLQNIEIDPSIVDKNETEMLSDFIIIAVNNALEAFETEKNNRIDEVTGNVDLNIKGLY